MEGEGEWDETAGISDELFREMHSHRTSAELQKYVGDLMHNAEQLKDSTDPEAVKLRDELLQEIRVVQAMVAERGE